MENTELGVQLVSGAIFHPISAEHPQARGHLGPWQRLAVGAIAVALAGEVGSLVATRGAMPALAGAGPVALTVCVLHFRDLFMPATGALTALAAWLIRGGFDLMGLHWQAAVPGTPGPATLYGQYLLLALLLQALNVRRWLPSPWRLIGLVLLAQLGAVTAEALGREFWLLPAHLPALLEAGLLRALIATGLVYLTGHRETETRWQETQQLNDRLWLLIIRLETEAFFLRKSAGEVERVTARSYDLYHRLKERPDEAELALEVAKDVHELKNDYQRILAGLDQVARYREVSQHLAFSDIVSLVLTANQEYAKRIGRTIVFSHRVNHDFVTADYAKWVSILNNLVTNAVEACDSGGHVHVEATLYPSRFIITVADDGPGIAQPDWDLVFVPGYSTKANPVTGTYSVGLGLTHARSLVQALNGHISIEDSDSAGTIFRLEFPPTLCQAEARQDGVSTGMEG